jgi:hypothetical protein
MFAGKTVRCDCGYEVRAPTDRAFLTAIRRHAWEAHGIEFSAGLALDVAMRAQIGHSELEAVGRELDRATGRETR